MSNIAVPKTKTLTDVAINSNNTVYKLLSSEDVNEITKRALSNEDVTVVEYALRPYSDDKLGFLCSHYRLDVTASVKKEEIITLSLFLKTIPYEVPDQADYVKNIGFFERETKYFEVIMPLLLERYRGKPWAPICYKVTEDVLAFEDLGSKNYSTRDKLFDETLVRAGLSAIARLHAASLLAETHLGIPFNQLHPDIFMKTKFTRDEPTRQWTGASLEVAMVVAERHGHDPNVLRVAYERLFDIAEPSRTKKNVINHGDLWANNLMFNNEVPPNCLLVDYQVLKYVPLAHDIATFLYLCTDRNFREARESAMLRHYYEELCEIMSAHEAPQKPTWPEVVEGMEELRLTAATIAVLYFPFILVDDSITAQNMKDSAAFTKYMFQDRKEFVLSVMNNDSIFEKRMNEAVLEMVELSSSRLDQLPKSS